MTTRALTFPDQAVGVVVEITSGREQPAAGRVEVDGSQPVRLRLERDHAAVLASLGPDDLQSLFLNGERSLKPKTIAAVARLSGLRELWASCKGAWDDEALAALSALTDLRSFGILNAYGVTDAGFTQLSALPQLVSLRVQQTRITAEGLAVLEHLPALSALTLSYARQLDDRALPAIGAKTALTWLSLDGTAITDEGMQHLRRLTSLRVLWLGSTAVTGEGLRHLPANDPPIRLVGVGNRPRSRAEWAQLQEQHPHLDFGGVRELTADASTRQRVREHGTPLGGYAVPDDGPLLAVFTTDHCAPCERLLPVIEELGRHWHDRLATVQVHSPDHPEIAQALNIMSAPTLILFTGAERTVRLVANPVLEELKAELAPYLGLAG